MDMTHWEGAQCGKVNLGENWKLVAMVTKLFTKNILLAAIWELTDQISSNLVMDMHIGEGHNVVKSI